MLEKTTIIVIKITGEKNNKKPLIKDKFLDNNMGKIKLRMNSNKVK